MRIKIAVLLLAAGLSSETVAAGIRCPIPRKRCPIPSRRLVVRVPVEVTVEKAKPAPGPRKPTRLRGIDDLEAAAIIEGFDPAETCVDGSCSPARTWRPFGFLRRR